MKVLKYLVPAFSLIILSACNNETEPDPSLEIPSTYEFTRNGESSVSFSGQTTRLDMLSEMKSYLGEAHGGNEIEEDVLLGMYANENASFSDSELNSADKQLENKTFSTDIEFFKEQMAAAAIASRDYFANQQEAAEGQSGLIQRGTSGNFILVSEKGWEYQQVIEKGLMGAVFLNQIYNVYLTDDRIGPTVENEELVEGENYTSKEHHWDEAFGYWGVPIDFPAELESSDNRFWANYSYGREELLGTASNLRDAYLKGRTAIVNGDDQSLEEATEVLYETFEITAAATAVHYLNSCIEDINSGDQGNLFHHASEVIGFVMALKYSPFKRTTTDEIETIIYDHLGEEGDFWKISLEGINEAKQLLISNYEELEPFMDQL